MAVAVLGLRGRGVVRQAQALVLGRPGGCFGAEHGPYFLSAKQDRMQANARGRGGGGGLWAASPKKARAGQCGSTRCPVL
jgi:hypothetical protein